MAKSTPMTAQLSGYVATARGLKDVGNYKVYNFTVAYEPFRAQETTWINCQVWGKRAETAARFLTKGTGVALYGTLDFRTYTGKDGTPKTGITMNVNDFSFFSKNGSQFKKDDQQESDFQTFESKQDEKSLDGWGDDSDDDDMSNYG